MARDGAGSSPEVARRVVVRRAAQCLAHVPDLVPYGSKPRRELLADRGLAPRLRAARRDADEAVAYPPNQVFIGNLTPQQLRGVERPWYGAREPAPATGPFGEIVDQETFLALVKLADVLEPPLFVCTDDGAAVLEERLKAHPLFADVDDGTFRWEPDGIAAVPDGGPADTLEIRSGDRLLGRFHGDERAEGVEDETLRAPILLENLAAKASGALALRRVLHDAGCSPADVDFVISCGEEACGDRYQRGGGGMAKAIGEMAGCVRASGMDVKDFCAGPASAIVTAGALVASGLHDTVAVVAGGSVAKLGMKLPALLAAGLPVLEDCLAGAAFLVTADDGFSAVLRLGRDAVGLAPIGGSTSDEAVYRGLLLDPLDALGLQVTDVDRFAPELHNPEVMEHSGSGDVARKNFRAIAAMAVMAGQVPRDEYEAYVDRISLCGFAPTQGHIPSGVAYLGFALDEIRRGVIRRAMVLSKASLFLNRLTELYDGVSFVIEANPSGPGPEPAPGVG